MGQYSLRKKKGKLHHPGLVTAPAIMHGRFIEPQAVNKSRQWQARQLAKLLKIPANQMTHLQARLLRNLTKQGAKN